MIESLTIDSDMTKSLFGIALPHLFKLSKAIEKWVSA